MASPHASTSSSVFRNSHSHSDSEDDDDHDDAAFKEARTDAHNSSDDSDASDNEQDDPEDWHDPSELAVSSSIASIMP